MRFCRDEFSICVIGPLFPERGFKPLTNFKRNLTALSSWNSVYTSAIAFIVSPTRTHTRDKETRMLIVWWSYNGIMFVLFGKKTAGLSASSDKECNFVLCVLHRSTCMRRGTAGPSRCSCFSPSCASPWIVSLPGQSKPRPLRRAHTHTHTRAHTLWCALSTHQHPSSGEAPVKVYTWIYRYVVSEQYCHVFYLCVPMMHCSQRLEDPVEHRTWSVRASGEKTSLLLF